MARSSAPNCPVCGSVYIVVDQTGKYCLGCHARPNEPVMPTPPQAPPRRLQVSWGDHEDGASWVKLRNPTTGEVCEIRAKGLDNRDKWIFGRIPPKKRNGTCLRFEPNPDDIAKTETERIKRELERQQWDDEAVARMKKAAENMSCALCHKRTGIDYVSGLCRDCEDK